MLLKRNTHYCCGHMLLWVSVELNTGVSVGLDWTDNDWCNGTTEAASILQSVTAT